MAISANELAEMNAENERMQRAFRLVDPSAGGKVPGATWRDRIDTFGTVAAIEAACAALDVTLDDVIKSVAYMTATPAGVERFSLHGQSAIRITAVGYRMGPAGDH